ncbi:hypothetical protein Tco_0547494 [Tanacetum coccineum]
METKDVHAIKYKMSKAKERCMTYFRSLHSHLQVLSKEDLKGTRIGHGFKRAFMSLFGQDDNTFTNVQYASQDYGCWIMTVEMTDKYCCRNTLEVKHFCFGRNTYSNTWLMIKKICCWKATDIIKDSYGYRRKGQDESSRSGNDTDTDDADIRPIYDKEPMAEVQLTTECNIFAMRQQHTEQPEIINEGRVK